MFWNLPIWGSETQKKKSKKKPENSEKQTHPYGVLKLKKKKFKKWKIQKKKLTHMGFGAGVEEGEGVPRQLVEGLGGGGGFPSYQEPSHQAEGLESQE